MSMTEDVENTKKEIEGKAKLGLSGLSMRTQWCSTSWRSSVEDKIAMDVTYQETREHDNLKEGRATKKRRRDGPSYES